MAVARDGSGQTPTARRGAWYRALGRSLVLAVVFLGLLFNGSVVPPYEQATAILAAGVVLLFLPIRLYENRHRKLITAAGVTVAAGAAWIALQAAPALFPGGMHQVWEETANTLPDTVGALSVNPARTLSALPNFVLPPLIFMTVLALCQDKRGATRMWIGLAWVGVLILAISAGLELFFPNRTFFAEHSVGFSTFSGVFVYRNAAAAVFAVTAFALAGAFYILRADARGSGRRLPGTLHAVLLVLALIAIMTTQSRAGSFMAIPILFLCLALIQFTGSGGGAPDTPPRYRRGVLQAFGLLAAGIALFAVFGDAVLQRFVLFDGPTLDTGRSCTFAATWAAVRDNAIFGTGFGTFADIFPAYRDAGCSTPTGVWLQAHNGFLELALGLGVPAAVALLAVLYGLLWTVCRHGWRQRETLRAIPVLSFGLVLYLTAHSLVDFPLQLPGVALYAAALLGAGCAVSLIERPPVRYVRRRRVKPPPRALPPPS
jgi:O-antigen ligase